MNARELCKHDNMHGHGFLMSNIQWPFSDWANNPVLSPCRDAWRLKSKTWVLYNVPFFCFDLRRDASDSTIQSSRWCYLVLVASSTHHHHITSNHITSPSHPITWKCLVETTTYVAEDDDDDDDEHFYFACMSVHTSKCGIPTLWIAAVRRSDLLRHCGPLRPTLTLTEKTIPANGVLHLDNRCVVTQGKVYFEQHFRKITILC